METSKDNIFHINYTSVLGEKKLKRKKRTSSLKKFIINNKLVSIAIIIFGMCFLLNCILIYNFIRILENM